jgi:uncharacterized protein YndB with AHSA1/START domain
MPITSVTSDPKALTLTVVGDYPVKVERLWEAYSDPRQLERFWGPETWPAKFTSHDFTVGGQAHYTMTGPDGATSSGWWRFLAIEPLRLIEIEDGFSNPDGTPNTSMPSMRMTFTFEETASGALHWRHALRHARKHGGPGEDGHGRRPALGHGAARRRVGRPAVHRVTKLARWHSSGGRASDRVLNSSVEAPASTTASRSTPPRSHGRTGRGRLR